MLKDVKGAVGKIKDKVEEVMDQIKQLKQDVEDMKECIEKMKKEFEGADFIELGKKCKDANKTSVKDCYEHAYGIILAPASSKAKSGGPGGCCALF
jgi:archaellum component FlaC